MHPFPFTHNKFVIEVVPKFMLNNNTEMHFRISYGATLSYTLLIKNASDSSPFSFLFYSLKFLKPLKLSTHIQVSTFNIQSIKEFTIKLTFGKFFIFLYIFYFSIQY